MPPTVPENKVNDQTLAASVVVLTPVAFLIENKQAQLDQIEGLEPLESLDANN